MIAASEWHILLFGLALVVSLFGKAQYSRMTHRDEDEVRRAEQLGLQSDDAGAVAHLGRARVRHRVTPMDFVQAMKFSQWGDVTTGRDFKRITETFMDAVERGADGALIGFVLRGHPTRVVWADVEVLSAGIIPPRNCRRGFPAARRPSI